MNDDPLRHILELTLQQAKKRQNPESGLIATGEHVLLYDNFLFCLALFRSKGHVDVQAAKKLLEHLLYFQQRFDDVANFGNFPLVLSDYPYCHDHLQALRILPTLIMILKEFSQVLGAELRSRLDRAVESMLSHLHKIHQEIIFPYWAEVKYYSVLAALDRPRNFSLNLENQQDLRTWGDPANLAEMLIASLIAPNALDFGPLYSYLCNTWHKKSRAFIGPAFKLGNQNSFLNMALGLFNGLPHLGKEPPLTAVLLQESDAFRNLKSEPEIQKLNDRFSYKVVQNADYGYSLLTGAPNPELMPGFFPFHLVSGEHSLAIQAPVGHMSEEYVFEIPETLFAEEKEKSRALMIWFNDHKDCEILIAGEKATCFELGDPLEIRLGDLKVGIRFEKIAGDGEFIGHISRANRSGLQHLRLVANDVQVFLRALRGTMPCKLRLNMQFIQVYHEQ